MGPEQELDDMLSLNQVLERLAELLGLGHKPAGARVPVRVGPVVRRAPRPPRR